MLEWLASALVHIIEWILDRSTAEVILFMILGYLVRIETRLIDINGNLRRVKADIQELGGITHTIMTATEDIKTAANESADLIAEIRQVQAPRSYEIDRYD